MLAVGHCLFTLGPFCCDCNPPPVAAGAAGTAWGEMWRWRKGTGMPLAQHLPSLAHSATAPTATPALGFVVEGSGGKGGGKVHATAIGQQGRAGGGDGIVEK